MSRCKVHLYILTFLFALALVPTSATGQTLTQVSGTITDPNGLKYSNAQIVIQLAGGGSTPMVTPCASSPCNVTNPGPIQADVNGHFSIALWANASIAPSGTTWCFNVNEAGVAPPWGTGAQSFSSCQTISGATDDLSSALSALAPAMTPAFSGGGVSPVGPTNAPQCVGSPTSKLEDCSQLMMGNPGVFLWAKHCPPNQANCFQGTDDDATDNCGAALTSWVSGVNGYTGTGTPQVWIVGGAASAYQLASCNVNFTIPVSVHLWATIDCAQSTANCIQLGPSGLSGFTAAQFPSYAIAGPGRLIGGASLTVAGIEAEPYISAPVISLIDMYNFGAANATDGNCTNWAISFDGPNNGPSVSDTRIWNTDTTAGRCGIVNNRLATNIGSNTLFLQDSIISGNATSGLGSTCGSVGLFEDGAASQLLNDFIGGFGMPIRLGSQSSAFRTQDSNFDTGGCTAKGRPAAIFHIGSPSGAGTQYMHVTGNWFNCSAGTACTASNYVIVQAGDASATAGISNLEFTENFLNGGASNLGLINLEGGSCSGSCLIQNNQGPSGSSDSTQAICLANSASPAACGGALRGRFAVPASTTTYTVDTTAASLFGQVQITQTTNNTGIPSSPTCNGTATTPIVSAITTATSFTFTLTSNASPTCYEYVISKSQ